MCVYMYEGNNSLNMVPLGEPYKMVPHTGAGNRLASVRWTLDRDSSEDSVEKLSMFLNGGESESRMKMPESGV